MSRRTARGEPPEMKGTGEGGRRSGRRDGGTTREEGTRVGGGTNARERERVREELSERRAPSVREDGRGEIFAAV